MVAEAVLSVLKPWTGRISCLSLPLVGLDDVVEVFDLPVLRISLTLAVLLQLRQGGGVGWCLVGVDDTGLLPILQAAQRPADKALRRRSVARQGEVEVDGVPVSTAR